MHTGASWHIHPSWALWGTWSFPERARNGALEPWAVRVCLCWKQQQLLRKSRMCTGTGPRALHSRWAQHLPGCVCPGAAEVLSVL